MDTRLCNGDFAKGENGLPEKIEGVEELLQQAQIRLCIPKGAFVHDPSLGSRLPQLQPAPAEAMEKAALMYAREALADMPQAEALGVQVETGENGWPAHVSVELKISREWKEAAEEIWRR